MVVDVDGLCLVYRGDKSFRNRYDKTNNSCGTGKGMQGYRILGLKQRQTLDVWRWILSADPTTYMIIFFFCSSFLNYPDVIFKFSKPDAEVR